MDGQRFDTFAKTLGQTNSRRGFLKVLAGGVLAGLGFSSIADRTSAANDPSCTAFCTGDNLPHCQHDCTGNNNPQCQYNCTGNNNAQCQHTCAGNNNPHCTTNCAGPNNPKCAPPATCSQTVPTCSGGQAVCGTACASLQTDAQNCGSCGSVCPTSTTCSSGACVPSCGSGGQPYCPSSTCNAGFVCYTPPIVGETGGGCVACGGISQPCCSGSTCSSLYAGCANGTCVDCRLSGAGGNCVPSCGGSGQPCCSGSTCNAGYTCSSGTCVPVCASGQNCTSVATCTIKGGQIATCSGGCCVYQPCIRGETNCPP